LGSSFLLRGLTLGHDGGVELAAEIFRQFVDFGVAEDLDGFLSRIADDEAVVAPGQVIFQFSLNAGIKGPIEVVV
jgi:hypothetical protein